MSEAQQHWDEHYGERARVWSGRVNARLAENYRPRLRGGACLEGFGWLGS